MTSVTQAGTRWCWLVSAQVSAHVSQVWLPCLHNTTHRHSSISLLLLQVWSNDAGSPPQSPTAAALLMRVPEAPWQDWVVGIDAITFCKGPDGSFLELGTGAFGAVSWGGSQVGQGRRQYWLRCGVLAAPMGLEVYGTSCSLIHPDVCGAFPNLSCAPPPPPPRVLLPLQVYKVLLDVQMYAAKVVELGQSPELHASFLRVGVLGGPGPEAGRLGCAQQQTQQQLVAGSSAWVMRGASAVRVPSRGCVAAMRRGAWPTTVTSRASEHVPPPAVSRRRACCAGCATAMWSPSKEFASARDAAFCSWWVARFRLKFVCFSLLSRPLRDYSLQPPLSPGQSKDASDLSFLASPL